MDVNKIREIESSIKSIYESLPRNVKPKDNEFVVISAVAQEDVEGNIRIVSLGTGTKCLGKGQDNSKGNLIADSHAEVICRRSFCRFLMKEALSIKLIESSEASRYETLPTCPVFFDEVTKRFAVKTGWKFHIYISDNPCGDSAIYQRINGISFTGAKPIDIHNDSEIMTSVSSKARETTQQLMLLRTKSGRSSIEEKDKTTSMSCSDKLCRWIYLGYLGSVVSNSFNDFCIQSIIVGKDADSINDSQVESLHRTIYSRFQDAKLCHLPIITIGNICPISYSKSNKEISFRKDLKDSDDETKLKPRPCGLSINWIANSPCDILEHRRCKNCRGGTLEVTLAQAGVLQGAIKRVIGDDEISSRLCRRNMAKLNVMLQKHLSLFSDSSSSHKSTETYKNLKLSNVEYNRRRSEFLSLPYFSEWICDECPEFVIISDCDETQKAIKKRKR